MATKKRTKKTASRVSEKPKSDVRLRWEFQNQGEDVSAGTWRLFPDSAAHAKTENRTT